MSTSYITVERFKTLTAMPASMVDLLENTIAPGWLLAKLTARSRWIDSRLTKRYATPFGTPVPEAIEDWLTRIVTPLAYLRHGVDQLDAEFDAIKADGQLAETEIKEAADAEAGLFELPLREDVNSNGITKGLPYVYSEQSTVLAQRRKALVGRAETRNGRGTDG